MLSIIAKVNKHPRILPLLWNLIKYPLKFDYELLVYNNLEDESTNNILLNDLKLFNSSIKWKLFKPGSELLSIKNNHIYLSANAIPYKNAIHQLLSLSTTCYIIGSYIYPSALFALTTNQYSDYVSDLMLENTTTHENNCPYYYPITCDNQFKPLHSDAKFILENEPNIDNQKYSFIETNIYESHSTTSNK